MRPLPAKKAKFLELLAAGLSTEQAGQKIAISRATAFRWASDPEIQARLQELQSERLRQAYRKLLATVDTAIATLERLCHHQSGYVASQSARALLELTLKVTETLELESRIRALEDKLKALEASHAKDEVEAA